MKELVRSAFQWLAETRLARRVVDTLFRAKARRRIVELDRQSLARCQNRTLLGLVHKGHATRFGRDHDFRRIRNVEDFQRLVPLRTPAELWREYWQPAYPNLAGATWPGPIPYLAIASAAQREALPYVPVSPALWAAQQTAALTALAFVLHARPRARFCAGQLCLLGSETTLFPAEVPVPAERLEAIALRRLPPPLQSYALASPALDGRFGQLTEDRLLMDLAERSVPMPVTCLAGSMDRLARFFEEIKRASGRARIADVWPQLAAVLYTRGSNDADRGFLENEIGNAGVLCLEMYLRPEGAVAIEDPRQRSLRLLPDHGVYFEFVPVDQLGKLRPLRLSAAEVKLGVPYALALSSPAGIWACLVGSVVLFERRDPPLLRLLDSSTFLEQPPAITAAAAMPIAPQIFPLPPHHRRNDGKPARRPEITVHSAWSARADRE
jgi:GH3 auxin-responsive promoter